MELQPMALCSSLGRKNILISPFVQCLFTNPVLTFIQYLSSSALTLHDFKSFYTSLLASSTSKSQLKQIHSQIITSGLQENGFMITKFVNVSVGIGEISYARSVFDAFPEPYVHLWNAIIRGYSRHNLFINAIEMYFRMQVWGVRPDCFTLPHVLKACSGEFSTIKVGRIVHAQIFRHGFDFDVFVQNGLVAFYARRGEVEKARIVFDGLYDRTVVSWTCMIFGYAQNGKPLEALRIFSKMRNSNEMVDWIALVSVLRAYSDVEDLEHGKSMHGCIIKMGLEFEPDLRVALTAMYIKCSQVMIARSLFDQMVLTNVVQWNTMISGYAKNDLAQEAVILFKDMILKNIRPDEVTIRSAILACARVGTLEQARWMGCYIDNSVYKDDGFVCSALIDMYAKCGSVELARTVFNRTPHKEVVVWSAMLVGYGIHGCGKEAIDLFLAMKRTQVYPNYITFIGLLTACNHAGLVQEGWDFFHSMKVYGIEPHHQHYACVVDLLGRSGLLDLALEFVKDMKIEPGVTIWGALLSACKIYRHVALGEYAAERLFSLDPLNTGHYVQLSNLYASARMWSGVEKVRCLMKERGLSKHTGYSMVEINGKLQAFRMGDKSHPRKKEIYMDLERIERELKEAGLCQRQSLGYMI